MAGGQVTVRLDDSLLTALIRAMPGRTKKVVRENGEKVQQRAKELAHVITGSMRDSIYLNAGPGDSDYIQASGEARGDNKYAVIEPEVVTTTNRAGVIVGVAVAHGYYEEVRRAHKFLAPAADSVWPAFVDDCTNKIVTR